MLSENFAYPGLMKYFERISEIPRGSYNEAAIASYIENFAKERGLEAYKDKTNNVFVKLPATAGMENEPAILLQGHTDMVCEKNEGVEHDFLKDPLKLYEEDGWIRAEGTTLGADNGVAVAIMLYILDGAEGNLGAHPAIECLFTASEEVGLDGVKNFDYSLISARSMINMDSASESLIIAGCAGGIRSSITLPVGKTALEGKLIEISIKGLAGGHSGEDIDRGRANANKLMGRILLELSKKREFNIVSIEGGSKDNAIPREAKAVIAIKELLAVKDIANIFTEIKEELGKDDKGATFNANTIENKNTTEMFDNETTEKIIFFVSTVGNGVFEMNENVKGLVEFSRNLGIISTDLAEGNVEFVLSSRSSMETRIDFSTAQLDAYAKMIGATAGHYSRYPGWKYAESSAIRDKYCAAHKAKYGTTPEITVIHAGLECGIVKENIPDMDIISCGAVVLDLHSPDEALNKASFERFFGLVLDVITVK